MLKKLLVLISLTISSTSPLVATNESITSDEALFVRRILSFWNDQEYDLVRLQIVQFAQAYPQSEHTDSLWLLLGDLEYSQKRYSEAAAAYAKIRSEKIIATVQAKKFESLYRSRQWSELIRQIPLVLSKASVDRERLLYYYGEAWLQQAKANQDASKATAEYEAAEKAFEELLNSSYRQYAMVGLAEVHQALNHQKRAAELYLNLADLPDMSVMSVEDVLLKAASLQLQYDKDQAIITLARAAELKGKNTSTAVESQVGLLFEAGKFSDIVQGQDNWRGSIPSEKLPLVDLYIGRSYFALHEYQKALDLFKTLMIPQKLSTLTESQQKIFWLTYIYTAYHLNLPDEVTKGVGYFSKIFRDDPDLPKMIYLQGLAEANAGNYVEAEGIFYRLLKQYPNYDQRDSIAFENNRLLFKQKKWKESREAFLAFGTQYPKSTHRSAAEHYAILSLQHQIQEAQKLKEPIEQLQEQLLADLAQAVEKTPTEGKPQVLLQTAGVLCELKRYPQAFETLNHFLKDYPDHPKEYQTHVLLALCYEEGPADYKALIAHAEKALELSPDLPEKYRLHMHLFKAYLQLAQEAQKQGNQEDYKYNQQKAIDSLYLTYIEGQQPIGQDYALWLANEYFNPLQKGLNAYSPEATHDSDQLALAEKASKVFEKALLLNQDPLVMEGDLFKLSCVYAWQNRREEQIALLKNLIEQQNQHPEWPWKYRPRILFALAASYEAQENQPEALALFKQLNGDSSIKDTYLQQAIKLHYSRLMAATLPESSKNMQDPDVQVLLSNLKDLQIRKILTQEPLHLEAAIDYAFLRASLEPKDKQPEQLRTLLLKAKTGFSTQSSIWDKDYAAMRERDPDKDKIYQVYLMLMDAHIMKIEAEIAKMQGKKYEMEQKQEAAKSLYETLLLPEFAVSKYVVLQAQWGIQLER